MSKIAYFVAKPIISNDVLICLVVIFEINFEWDSTLSLYGYPSSKFKVKQYNGKRKFVVKDH
uniref:Uncharacterized protein n=1 Tax=Manihot esculenta TaxID=3983 RepID=A0A2C9V205_MANES